MAQVDNGAAENGAPKTVTFLSVKPQLFVEAQKAHDAVQFYKTAFGAEEVSRTLHPKRKADQELPLILSAEIKLGSSSILVSALADDSAASINSVGTGIMLCLETEDVDAAVAKAVAAGAVAEGEAAEAEDKCGGGCIQKLKDPYGYVWMICSSPAAKEPADAEA